MFKADGLNTYYGLSHILFDLSVELGDGEIVCILGRNGVGKTTLLRTLMGLTPPKTGRVELNGREVTGMRPFELARRGLGYVPAERCIFPDLTVRQNLQIAAKSGPGGAAEKDWTIEGILEVFPLLKGLVNRFGNQLSGGEQQVLATARAVMGHLPATALLEVAPASPRPAVPRGPGRAGPPPPSGSQGSGRSGPRVGYPPGSRPRTAPSPH